MKFQVEKRNLKRALKTVAPAMAQYSTIEQAKGILWFFNGTKLIIAACNGEIQIQTVCNCSISPDETGDGKVTFVTAKIVINMIDKLPDQRIEIDVSDDAKNITLKSGQSIYEMPVLGEDDFLRLSNTDDNIKTHLVINQGEFKAISKIAFAIAKSNNSFPVLTGMKLEKYGEKNVRLLATDGHRSATTKISISPQKSQFGGIETAIIPGETIKVLMGMQDEDRNMILEFDDKRLKIKTNDFTLKSMLLQGTFIDIDKVLSSLKEPACVMTLDSEEIKCLFNALDGLNVISKLSKSHLVRMEFEDGVCHIKGTVDEIGSGDQTIIIKNYAGEKFEIGFNITFFLENAKALVNEEEVTVKFFSSVTPLCIESKNSSYSIFPIRI